ncbi:hypothetical protein L1887_13413 [Cichorium endivia]|nr:hypothetical protein L1887_13413 [Cichorium endivia]
MNRNSIVGVGCVSDQGRERELDPTQIQAENNSPCAKTVESDKNKKFQAQFHKNGPSDGQGIESFVEVHNQVGDPDMEDGSDQDRLGGTQPLIELDGADSSHSIDLNSEPMERYDWHDLVEEYLLRHGTKKSKNKDKKSKKQGNAKSSTFLATMKPKDILKVNAYRKNKKAESSHKNQSSPNKSENSITISKEIIKTKNVGSEVGFQIEGLEEMLRNEIEGEGC